MKRKKLWYHGTSDQEQLLEAAFKHYRKVGFPYPRMTPMDLWAEAFRLRDASCAFVADSSVFGESRMLSLSGIGLKAANWFHRQIYDSHAVSYVSPLAAFNDDRGLRRAIRLVLVHGAKAKQTFDAKLLSMLRLVSTSDGAVQTCSNFRPAAAKNIYESFLPLLCRERGTGRILDPCAGYGGRLFGFVSLALKYPNLTYTGVDPAKQQHDGNLDMAEFYHLEDRVTHLDLPYEDADELEDMEPFDLAVTSPPYFDLEIYDDEPTQSRLRYPKYDAWVEGFMEPLLKRTWRVLKPGAFFVLNVANIKRHHERKGAIALADDCEKLAMRTGFELVERFGYIMSGFGKHGIKRKAEPVMALHRRPK